MTKIITIKTAVMLLSFIGSISVIISTWNFGLGLSPDSIEYLAAADNLLLGRGFLTYNGQPVTEWPPLYPVLLFLCSFTLGISTGTSAVVLNVILFGLIIYRSGFILIKYLKSAFLVAFGLLGLIFSIPVFSQTLWAQSELLFIFLITMYLDFLVSYIKKSDLLSYSMLIILTSLALLTRYIGITLILTAVVCIFIYKEKNFKKKITSVFAYSVLSVIPISIWIIRNYFTSQTFFGERGTARYSAILNIEITANKILSWVLPDYFINLKIFFLIFLFTVSIFLWLLISKKVKYEKLFSMIDKKNLGILILFVSIYIFVLISISTFKAHNSIDSRLLSPVYIPTLFSVLIILQAFYNLIISSSYFKMLRFVFIGLLILGIAKPASSTIKFIDYHGNSGGGYSGRLWQKENKKKWLIDIKKNYIKNSALFSNEPFEIYYLLNMYSKWAPRKTFYDSDDIYIRLIDLKGTWPAERRAYLAWFKKIKFHSTSLHTPEELASVVDMKIIDSSDVGTLYAIEIKNQ